MCLYLIVNQTRRKCFLSKITSEESIFQCLQNSMRSFICGFDFNPFRHRPKIAPHPFICFQSLYVFVFVFLNEGTIEIVALKISDT